MDRQQTDQMTPEQARRELRAAKQSLAQAAKGLSVGDCLSEHPYATLGAAFFSGILVGSSSQVRKELARLIFEAASQELWRFASNSSNMYGK